MVETWKNCLRNSIVTNYVGYMEYCVRNNGKCLRNGVNFGLY